MNCERRPSCHPVLEAFQLRSRPALQIPLLPPEQGPLRRQRPEHRRRRAPDRHLGAPPTGTQPLGETFVGYSGLLPVLETHAMALVPHGVRPLALGALATGTQHRGAAPGDAPDRAVGPVDLRRPPPARAATPDGSSEPAVSTELVSPMPGSSHQGRTPASGESSSMTTPAPTRTTAGIASPEKAHAWARQTTRFPTISRAPKASRTAPHRACRDDSDGVGTLPRSSARTSRMLTSRYSQRGRRALRTDAAMADSRDLRW